MDSWNSGFDSQDGNDQRLTYVYHDDIFAVYSCVPAGCGIYQYGGIYMVIRQTVLKKAAASIMVSAMLLSFGACSNNSKYTLENISLTESERSWFNP